MLDTIRAAHQKDPSLQGIFGYLSAVFYPGVQAIWMHKITSRLHRAGVPVAPVVLSQLARMLTGVEIHPGARIGKGFFIDHGTGVVIGETAQIGDEVMLYHGVTLGGRGFWKDKKGARRHPSLRDGVVVGVGATILGPVEIGKNSRVGAGAIVLGDAAANSRIKPGTTWRGG